MIELNERQEAFAQAYVRLGNGTHAYLEAIGQRTMQRHTLRARASEYLNHYLVAARIDELIAEKEKRREKLPRFRARTYRSDLFSK